MSYETASILLLIAQLVVSVANLVHRKSE